MPLFVSLESRLNATFLTSSMSGVTVTSTSSSRNVDTHPFMPSNWRHDVGVTNHCLRMR
eukprot:m.179498 g.179498  ORF g.179498 m.179498 type:complete len:59 (-) comp14936_c0_seq1:3698-3874(-)